LMRCRMPLCLWLDWSCRSTAGGGRSRGGDE
jgi:hypothetical protein